MTAPTGNRWVDQDKLAETGDPAQSIANPDNIQTDLPGHGQKVKYGPLVTENGDPPATTAVKPGPGVGQPIMPFEETTDPAGEERELEPGEQGEHEVLDEGRKLGPAVTAQDPVRLAQEQAGLQLLKEQIRGLNKTFTAPKTVAAERRVAKAALESLAKAEYARPDGGRSPVKTILARYGFGNPNKE